MWQWSPNGPLAALKLFCHYWIVAEIQRYLKSISSFKKRLSTFFLLWGSPQNQTEAIRDFTVFFFFYMCKILLTYLFSLYLSLKYIPSKFLWTFLATEKRFNYIPMCTFIMCLGLSSLREDSIVQSPLSFAQLLLTTESQI